MLVDLPGVGLEVIRRLSAVAGSADTAPDVLARAAFTGVPSHPVLIGRNHWAGVIASARDDIGDTRLQRKGKNTRPVGQLTDTAPAKRAWQSAP